MKVKAKIVNPVLNSNERAFNVPNSSGEKLAVVETLPKSPKLSLLPSVILVHGFAYFKEEDGLFIDLASRLSDLGCVVYRFDLTGCGESEGNFEYSTLTRFIDDLKIILKTVSSYPYIDSRAVSFIGHSFGANVIVAAELLFARRLVLSGSFYNPDEVLGNLFGRDFDPEGISMRRGGGGRTTAIGPQFWSDLKNYDLRISIARYNCPILFVHGSADTIVPIASMYPLLESAQNVLGKVILEGADHDLAPHRQTAYQKIIKFFS